MKALVFTAAGVVRLLDRPEPEPGADETVLTVESSAICGSELHGFRSVGFRVPPLVMGHEFAGTTPAGERVVVNPLLACGACDLCKAGLPQICRDRALIGVHRDGGFAERVAVPNAALRPLPDEIDWVKAALIEPLANAVHAWGLLEPSARRIAVIGAGPIGLLAALVCVAKGLEVTVAELSPERGETARSLGLDTVVQPEGEFDAVIDAVGVAATRRESVERLRPGGTAVWLGLGADAVDFGGNQVVREEKRIIGSFAYTPTEFDAAIALTPTLELGWGTRVPLSASEEAFYALAEGERSIVKAVIVPDSEFDR